MSLIAGMSIPFLAPSRWGIKLIKELFLETIHSLDAVPTVPSGEIIFTIPAELHLQPCAGYFIEAPPPGPLVGSDPRSERKIVQRRLLQTDRRLPHQCNSPESTATGRRHRGNRRGSHPSYCDTPEVQTRARTTDGKDGLRGNVSSHPCHAVQLTFFAKLKTERMVPVDAFVSHLVQRLRFFRSLDPLPADGRLLARPGSKVAFVRQLRDYLHQVCHSLNLSTRIVPHQLRHTYATEMLRAGVSFPALMKLLGHTDPDMTMRYVEVALTDLQREFQRARSHPRHLVPRPKLPFPRLRTGLDGVIDSLLAAQHVLEMFRRALPDDAFRSCLDRLSNRLTKIVTEVRKLHMQ
jgi:hypothetical protein